MLRIDYNILFTIVNLLILFWALRRFLFKPVREIMEKRADDIRNSFEEADQDRREAEEYKEQCRNQLGNIDEAKKQAQEEARRDAAKEYNRILADARKEAARIIQESKERAAAAADEERRQAESDIVKMIKSAASKIAESEDDSKMYDDFLREVNQEK